MITQGVLLEGLWEGRGEGRGTKSHPGVAGKAPAKGEEVWTRWEQKGWEQMGVRSQRKKSASATIS